MNITKIIQKNVASWWMDPDEINSGGCEDFAIDVLSMIYLFLGKRIRVNLRYILIK